MITFPLELDVVKPWLPEGYEGAYAAYPLDARRNWPGGNWTLPDVKSGKAAGLNGFSIDIFADGNAANGYLSAADTVGNFHIAACLDGGSDDEIVRAVTLYCDNAARHPSAAKVGDAFVIFTYGTSGNIRGDNRPARWQKLRDQIAAKGYKTWWMPDLSIDPSTPDFKQKLAAYFPVFEAGYSFSTVGEKLGELAVFYRQNGKAFGGGMMPGYYRLAAGYQDAQATATYRREWKRHLSVRPNWVHVSTWNDIAETTEIMPNSDFNLTRSDLTAWFAARFRGEKPPWKTARLYITTPKTVYTGQTYMVEGLVLNTLRRHLRVSVQLLDAGRKPFGAPVAAVIEPGTDGAAVVPLKLTAFPPGRFLRARATLSDNGKVIASVLSAPIAVLDPEQQPGFATLYYSVPAHKSLPGKVTMTLDGQPTLDKPGRVRLGAPAGTQRQFSEVLFNNEILKNFLREVPPALPVPQLRNITIGLMDGSVALPAGEIKGGTEWGFYMTRVTDTQNRVGYSDPVYIAPRGDLTIKERYTFDEGMGKVAHDSSAFRRAGELHEVEWVSGNNRQGNALSFNGRHSRFNMALSQTPVGPLSVKMTVRPRAYEGMFFCDSGGLWMTTTGGGNVRFVRLGPQGWTTATSTAKIPLGQWTQLEFTWDGAHSRIFISGQPDGEVACGPAFRSGRRALGCNPFGDGSGYYQGDLDNFEIKALPSNQ